MFFGVSQNFSKFQSLIAYNCIHKCDIICLSEILSNDNNSQIPGYYLVRIEHPSNMKRGGVCLCNKSLPLKVIDVSYLQECINSVVKISDKTRKFISLYRSPNQRKGELKNFIGNFELNLEHIVNKNPFLIVVLGDFNARMQDWY